MNKEFLKMQKLAGLITEAQYNQKISLIETQLNEDNSQVDFKLTELKNEKVSELKKVMVDNGLKVSYKLAGKDYKYEAPIIGSGWDAKKSGSDIHNSYLFWGGKPSDSIVVGIGKDTNKAQDILKFVENTFKEGYTIKKGGGGSYWEIKIEPQQQPVSENLRLNEDNLQVKKIAKDLYQFLKKNGVREVSLITDKKNIGKDTANDDEGRQIGDRMNTATIFCYDDEPTKQTAIDVTLFGDKDKIQEVEKILLQSYPGLAQANRELNRNSNSPKDKVWVLEFTVFEKSTRKGGLNR